jgi:hypothetical protein
MIKFAESKIKIKVGEAIPVIGEWSDDYTLQEKDTPIRFMKVTPLKWITERMVAIECEIEFYYYCNDDYCDQGEKKLAEVIPIRKDGMPEPPEEAD